MTVFMYANVCVCVYDTALIIYVSACERVYVSACIKDKWFTFNYLKLYYSLLIYIFMQMTGLWCIKGILVLKNF